MVPLKEIVGVIAVDGLVMVPIMEVLNLVALLVVVREEAGLVQKPVVKTKVMVVTQTLTWLFMLEATLIG